MTKFAGVFVFAKNAIRAVQNVMVEGTVFFVAMPF